jgi:hypothetical protein
MEHFSRAADFLFYFRTKFAELHTEEGKEMDAETAKYLDRLALVLLLHFEQVRRSADSDDVRPVACPSPTCVWGGEGGALPKKQR